MSTVYFDLETGGLEPQHPNIQLAAIAINDVTEQEIGTFEMKIEFDAAVCDPEALALNSYSPAAWKDAQPVPAVVKAFTKFLNLHKSLLMISKKTNRPYKVARLCGHNAATFDGPRLKNMFLGQDTFLPADPRYRCTMQLALWHFDWLGIMPPSYKLTDLCEWYDIKTQGAHDALTDVRLCVKLASALRKAWK